MRVRGKSDSEKIEPPMAPMIDVVFQLLIFFMLTLKIIEPEGNFNVNMPINSKPTTTQDIPQIDLKVKLQATESGELAMVSLCQQQLGNGTQAFQRLNSEILRMIGRPGNPLTEDMEVEIDADYNLHFQYVISAISACTGRLGEKGNVVRYVEKIKFAQPKRPSS